MPAPLLVLPLKVPKRHDLVQPLSAWLDEEDQVVSYQNSNDMDYDYDDENNLSWVVPKPSFKSTDCRKELLRIAALRNCLSENLQDSHKASMEQSNALEDLHEYHATLLEFEKRGFPTVDDENNGIALTWRGAFATRQEETHYTLVYDRACTMWNISALLSSLAAEADCTNKEGCKIAISQNQTAASLLATLRQLLENEKDKDYATVDLSPNMISMWEKIFLAQGQLTIYRMANLGGGTVRQHTTLAYLVQAAASLYNEALSLAQDPRLQSELPKFAQEWAVHCKNQSLICQCRARFHLSIEHRLKQDHGPEIARLRECVTTLKDAQDFAKTTEIQQQMQEVQSLVQMAKDRLVRAEEDNNKIYMDDVPRDLPEIRAQTMVKQNVPLAPTMMMTKMPLFVQEITTTNGAVYTVPN